MLRSHCQDKQFAVTSVISYWNGVHFQPKLRTDLILGREMLLPLCFQIWVSLFLPSNIAGSLYVLRIVWEE